MTLAELQELIELYGKDARVVDVLANLELMAEMGAKLQGRV